MPLVIEELAINDSKFQRVSDGHVVTLSHLAEFPEKLAR